MVNECAASCLLNVQRVVLGNAGLSDKTAKLQECPAIFVSLPDSVSDKKYSKKCTDSVLG